MNHDVLQHLLRREHGRLVASLARTTGGDLQLAEDALQQAALAAFETWTEVPSSPVGWLLRTARNKAIDQLRRQGTWARKAEQLGHEAPEPATMTLSDEQIPDERLRLICTCCHPALAREVQVALTLKTVAGLTSDELARAFLVDRTTMQQRLVRAKKKIRVAGIPYEVPGPEGLAVRLQAILQVIYVVFTEGWAATAGDDLVRRDLCVEAIQLGLLLARLLADEGEVHGLLSLMLLQDSRRAARQDLGGLPVLLAQQDRTLWDRQAIGTGMMALKRAGTLGPPGRYTLQAAIASVHARAAGWQDTDWSQIAQLYDLLMLHFPTSVVALNQAAAQFHQHGPEAGLAALAPLEDDPNLVRGHLLPSAKAAMLRAAGQPDQALECYRIALARVGNEPERRWLEAQLVALAGH